MREELKNYAEYLLGFAPKRGRLRLNLESYIESGHVKDLIPLHSNYTWKRNMLEVFAEDLGASTFKQFICIKTSTKKKLN